MERAKLSPIICYLMLINCFGCIAHINEKDSHSMINDTIIEVAANKKYKRNPVHDLLFGRHYRHIWATKVSLPVFDINSIKGGLQPLKRGGGQQTISVHLEDSLGRRFVLRSADKDPAGLLPKELRGSFINTLLIDQISAQNPYAPMIVDELSQAAGVYFTTSDFYFVPADKRLAQIAEELQNSVAMLEEKPNSTWKHEKRFDYPDKVHSSEKMLEKRFEKQHVLIDQKLLLRSRLLDILINDWDRHINQWAWLGFEQGDSIIYRPVARDRDVAFFMFDDGFLPFLASRWFAMPKFTSFNPYIDNIDGMLIQSRYLDKNFLNELTYEDWMETVDDLLEQFSDVKIHEAVRAYPHEIYDKIGIETACRLISRKKDLKRAATRFYESVNEHAQITGTDKSEKILVERLNNNNTRVMMWSNNNDKMLFDKTYDHAVTRSITIRTIGGDDLIEVIGEVKNGIRIDIYGGHGTDTIIDRSSVKSLRKKTFIYDSLEGNKIVLGPSSADKRSDDPEILDIDRIGVNRPDHDPNQ